METKKQPQKTHGSLEKGLGLLSAFVPENKERGTVELSKLFSMNRSTVSRMLTVLKRSGFVIQNPENKKYSLGPFVASLSAAYQSSFESTITQFAKPYLDQLRRELNQTVVLEIPSGDHTVVTYVTEGLGPVKIRATVGDWHSYHTSAGGKCILAFAAENVVDRVLQSELPRLTPQTIVEPEKLAKELGKIRKTGFAFDGEGSNTGICAFGLPVFIEKNHVAAAIVAAGPTNLVSWEEREFFVEKMQTTADKISRVLTNSAIGSL